MKHKIKNIHFVGVGGVGMSGIAEVLANLVITSYSIHYTKLYDAHRLYFKP